MPNLTMMEPSSLFENTPTVETPKLKGAIKIRSEFEKEYLINIMKEESCRLEKESATGTMSNVLTSVYEGKIISALIEHRRANLDAIEIYFKRQRNRFSTKFYEQAIERVKSHIEQARKLNDERLRSLMPEEIELTLKSVQIEDVQEEVRSSFLDRIFGRRK